MNKLEIIYNDGTWILLNGAGEIVYQEHDRYAHSIPSGLEKQIRTEFGLDRE